MYLYLPLALGGSCKLGNIKGKGSSGLRFSEFEVRRLSHTASAMRRDHRDGDGVLPQPPIDSAPGQWTPAQAQRQWAHGYLQKPAHPLAKRQCTGRG